MPDPVLTVEHLTKRYEEQDAIYDLSFSINEGEILAVHGQAGSGKTTLLKLCSGLIPTSSGKIVLNGELLIAGKPENAINIGLLLQGTGTYNRLTVKEYLTYFQRLYGVEKGWINEIINRAGLIDRQNLKISKLSKNLHARLRLAQVLLHKPKLILLDSPTSNLDMETAEILRNMIINAAEEGAAVLLTSSYQAEVHFLATHIARINRGRIESIDKADSVKLIAEDSRVQLLDKPIKVGKIPAKVNDKTILFNPMELTYIESQEGSSVLHTGNEEFPCPLTLSELETKLTPFGFFRCHRSYIVNLQRVREVIPWTRNSYSLVLDDLQKTSVPLSKNSLKELEERLEM